jgi:hypothetical protein
MKFNLCDLEFNLIFLFWIKKHYNYIIINGQFSIDRSSHCRANTHSLHSDLPSHNCEESSYIL